MLIAVLKEKDLEEHEEKYEDMQSTRKNRLESKKILSEVLRLRMN